MNKQQKEEYIRALLSEREGAERYGKTDTVEQIDEELRKVGHAARTPHQRATKMAPQKRGDADAKGD